MESTTLAVSAADGTSLHTYRWLPDGPPRGIVQIAHGMAEHAARYERFAEALTGAGYAVYANDHRGHGETASAADHGYFADHDGFNTVVTDMSTLSEFARAEHPGVPLVLFGHSMGSFLSRAYAAQHGARPAALVLSGTGGDPGLLGGREAGGRRPSTTARAPSPVRSHGQADVRAVQLEVQAQPHRLRLALARRGRSRQVRRGPAVRQRVQRWLLCRPARRAEQINGSAAFAAVRRDLPILIMSGELTLSATAARARARSATSTGAPG